MLTILYIIIVTIYHAIIFIYFSSFFLSHKSKNKSPGGFEKWTFLKMSKNENLEKVLKKGSNLRGLQHNALKLFFRCEKSVTIFFCDKISAFFLLA
jgi:hypothetical protein